MQPWKHAKLSAKRRGTNWRDELPVHEFIDSAKGLRKLTMDITNYEYRGERQRNPNEVSLDVIHGDKMGAKVTLCEKFQKERPFNGLKMATLNHPWCQTWNTTLDNAICTTKSFENRGGLSLTCADAAKNNLSFDRTPVCSTYDPAITCEYPELNSAGVNEVSDDGENYTVVAGGANFYPPAAVHGVHCYLGDG